jgi:hypothetical protein
VPWQPLAAHGEIGLLLATAYRAEYMLTRDGFNFVAYFEKRDFGGFVHRGLTTELADKTKAPFEGVLLRPDEAGSRGLGRPLHLVRFDVNDGRGATESAGSFLLTSVVVLDKSDEFPIDPSAAYDVARERIRARFAAARPELEQLLESALARHDQKSGERSDPVEWALSARGTWLTHEQELSLLLEQSLEEEVVARVSEEIPCRPCPPGGVCVACGPVTRAVRTRAVARIGGSFRFDRRGKLVREEARGPELL